MQGLSRAELQGFWLGSQRFYQGLEIRENQGLLVLNRSYYVLILSCYGMNVEVFIKLRKISLIWYIR